MNYNSTYLGTTGLTSSEANYTANIAKELAEKIKSEISQMSLFKKTLFFEGKEKPFNNVVKVNDLEKKCTEEGLLYALSAWLREGIKAKSELTKQVQYDSFGLSFEEYPDSPTLKAMPTVADIKNSLPIKELAEYLAFEAKAAHIGKKVHPDGIFESWFKQLRNTLPVEIHPQNKGYIVETEAVIKEEELYKIFFNLQQEYREAEQKVNYYKAKIENILNEEIQKVNAENRAMLSAYQEAIRKVEANNKIISSKIESERSKKLNELSQLKVIIPNELQSVLDTVQEHSKKKK